MMLHPPVPVPAEAAPEEGEEARGGSGGARAAHLLHARADGPLQVRSES